MISIAKIDRVVVFYLVLLIGLCISLVFICFFISGIQFVLGFLASSRTISIMSMLTLLFYHVILCNSTTLAVSSPRTHSCLSGILLKNTQSNSYLYHILISTKVIFIFPSTDIFISILTLVCSGFIGLNHYQGFALHHPYLSFEIQYLLSISFYRQELMQVTLTLVVFTSIFISTSFNDHIESHFVISIGLIKGLS